MDFFDYTNKKTEEVFKELNSGPDGLDQDEAQKRLAQNGPNKITSQQTTSWTIFLRQLKSPFIYLLLGAAILALVLGETSNTIMILAFVAINCLIGFFQENRSEQTVKLLSQHFSSKAKVKRNGSEIEIDTSQLIVGDIVILETGDIVPVDMRLIESENFVVDESVLTGESAPVSKTNNLIKAKASEIHQAKNIIFSGTTVVSGRAVGLVIATGKQTAFGKVSSLTSETKRKSLFEIEIGRFSKFILRFALVTIGTIFLANLILKGASFNFGEMALFSIALAVSVVPEALPLVTTFAFSRGALRLAKKGVIVKRLSSVEDLGGIEILCTDKTGTLTENQMAVDEIFCLEKKPVLFYSVLGASLYQNSSLNNFDSAILQASKKEPELKEYEKLEKVPFDPQRKRDTALLRKGKRYEIVSRGAPEAICSLINLSKTQANQINNWIAQKGREGKRILAIAKKVFPQKPKDIIAAEKDLEFLGLISFTDPVKKTTQLAIDQAQKMGIRIKILTGDRIEVAETVGREIKLISETEKAITGADFDLLSLEQKHQAVEKYHIFARVSPQQKYQIIELLQEKNKVGFLGDGINDGPGLKIANVALVVQGASDVAKQAADIILLKKDLKVIVDGIREGREIFSNTTKYITATLSANFGNFYAVAISSLLIDFLPMLPVQILLVNLLSDFPMIAMATDKVDAREIRVPQKYDLKSIIYLVIVLGLVSSIFDFLTFAIFSKASPAVLQTSWFMESILTELVFIFSIRSPKMFSRFTRPSAFLTGFIVFAGLITIILPFTGVGQNLIGFIRPTGVQMAIIVTLVISYLLSTESAKLAYNKIVKNNHLALQE